MTYSNDSGRPPSTATSALGVWRSTALLCAVVLAAHALAARDVSAADGRAATGANRIDVCGPIDADTTWSAANVWVITCDIAVEAGATLTIEPGTVVKLAYNRDLAIREGGTLMVNGKAEAPVVVTSLADDAYGVDTNSDGTTTTPAPGDWASIYFYPGSRGRLTNAVLRYGGGYYARGGLVQARSSDVVLDGVTLERSADAGLYAELASPTITRSLVRDNAGVGLRFWAPNASAPLVVTANRFAANLGMAGEIEFIGQPHGPVSVEGNQAEATYGGFRLYGETRGEVAWDNSADLPLVVGRQDLSIASDAVLTLGAGTLVKIERNRDLEVRGELIAEGEASAPVVFTSILDDSARGDTNGDGAATVAAPGDWASIYFYPGSRGRLTHAELRYGGGYYTRSGLVQTHSNDVVLDGVILEHSADAGLLAENGSALVRGTVAGNPRGIHNETPSKGVVDARRVWWGDASGPLHRTKNPEGTGNEVSDGVLFFPWAVDEDGTVPTQVTVEGPSRVSPGETVDYAVSYYAGQDVHDAVLIFALPERGFFIDATAGGLLWPERFEVIWKLGDLTADTQGTVSSRVRYMWGLAGDSISSALALLQGSNLQSGPFSLDIPAYLDFEPVSVLAERALETTEIEQELVSHDEIRALYDEVKNSGSWLAGGLAYRLSSSAADVRTLILGNRNRADEISREDRFVIGSQREPMSATIRDGSGGMTVDLARLSFQAWGTWAAATPADAGGGAAAYEVTWAPSRCMYNCLIQGHVYFNPGWDEIDNVGNYNMRLLTTPECRRCQETGLCAACLETLKQLYVLSGGNVSIDDVMKGCKRSCFQRRCLSDGYDCTFRGNDACDDEDCTPVDTRPKFGCENSPTEEFHVCVHSGQSSPSSGRGFPVVAAFRCDRELGVWVLQPGRLRCPVYSRCYQVDGSVSCAGGPNCKDNQAPQPMDQWRQRLAANFEQAPSIFGPEEVRLDAELGDTAEPRNCSLLQTTVRIARDPNAKHGPVGDVIPGQEVAYTVEYENVGEGSAYGVYVTDELSPHLDETTLDLHGQGAFLPATRSIVWDIGELAPKGQEGSKGERSFSIRVKSGLPSGTVITNQAIVYFPSVPEETATNTVVNVVQPLAAVPQTIETPYGTPIAITLTGRDVSGTPLTYAIAERPLSGELTGTPPNLIYTHAQNFTGQDRFTYTVSNGVSTSRSADVTVLVTPSAADTIGPEVTWTYPENGAVLEDVPSEPVSNDDTGPLYSPSVLAGFSEAMDPNSIMGTTVRVVAGTNREVQASVLWDGTSNQAVLVPREAWQDGSYTATVTTGARDASGNALAAEYSWSFRIGASTCTGDCNGNGAVTVDELLTMVNVALGNAAVSECLAGDASGDEAITVDEILTAVNVALNGCE